MYIDKKSPIPVYYQLKSNILSKIKGQEYTEDNLIPSERELGELLGISRMTVRQALNQLVAEGVLYREKGKGTFVAKQKIVQKNIMSFSETVKLRGLVPSTEILYFCKNTENQKIREILDVEANECLYHLKRLRLANQKPIGIEEVFLPERYFHEFEKHDFTSSLYTLIREDYLYIINHIDSTIQSEKPSKEEKTLLKLSANIPVLRISGISYSSLGVKLFYQNDVYRSDEYTYNIRIFMDSDT
ncbi:MAG: GntR family transcriptional regulator [Vallitaleaceae bacterium]|nr:GntR family transcriptional regulator [Vallitaleaceae bacterium]